MAPAAPGSRPDTQPPALELLTFPFWVLEGALGLSRLRHGAAKIFGLYSGGNSSSPAFAGSYLTLGHTQLLQCLGLLEGPTMKGLSIHSFIFFS